MLSWVIPLKALKQIPKVVVSCKYYLIIAEIMTLNAVQHSLYITSSSEQFQLAGVLSNKQISYMAKYIMSL